jgi:hypothetical protein
MFHLRWFRTLPRLLLTVLLSSLLVADFLRPKAVVAPPNVRILSGEKSLFPLVLNHQLLNALIKT